MAVAIFTVLLIGFILGGSTVYLVENHLRTNEMNKIYKLTEIIYVFLTIFLYLLKCPQSLIL